jgi:GT2 family glycosyltransferase
MHTAVVIPSLGAPHLEKCLEAVTALAPAPETGVVVLSGGAGTPRTETSLELQKHHHRLGFAAAVNSGVTSLPASIDAVAILNDDAVPDPAWLGVLVDALERNPKTAAVQGTLVDSAGPTIDGRGIVFDRYGLPVQIDRGSALDEDHGERSVLAVSGTAALFRMQALTQARLQRDQYFDQRFDSYHEDLDLGLRLARLGWGARWVGGARCRHLGSASGPAMCWRHPWWLLANRWRALGGNLSPAAFIRALPRLIRGELRATRTLSRTNPRALPVAAGVVAASPLLVLSGMLRKTPGPRFEEFPEGPP